MNATNENVVTLDMLKNLSADLQSKRKEASNQTVAQQKALASKPKRAYKRQTKANRVRKLLRMGMSVSEISAKAKVSANYVYHIRWYDNKAAGIGSLRKKKVSGEKQVPFGPLPDPLPETLIPISPYVPMSIATPKLTLWERVRDFVGL
jgi:hypothetical protein